MRPIIPLAILTLTLAACGTRPTVIRDRFTPVSIPVLQPCASEKPAAVVPMNQRYSQEKWDAMTPKQRAQIAASQGLTRMTHTDELGAATSAC